MKKFPYRLLGGNFAFRYNYNPYDGETMECPLCKKTISAGYETCPECSETIPGHQHSREKVGKSPLVILMALCFLAVFGLAMYFFIRAAVDSGFFNLLLNR